MQKRYILRQQVIPQFICVMHNCCSKLWYDFPLLVQWSVLILRHGIDFAFVYTGQSQF